jgi:hypothetical protein
MVLSRLRAMPLFPAWGEGRVSRNTRAPGTKVSLPTRLHATLDHILGQDQLIERYRALCAKGRDLQVDLIEGIWPDPDYYTGLEVIHALQREMIGFDKDLSEREMMTVFHELNKLV